MIIKICGITNYDDAWAAIEAGATALGFNFYPRSKRWIGVRDATELIARLPQTIWKVGVFVNEPPERVADLVHRIGLSVAQLHGDELPEQYPPGVRVWKAARVGPDFDWSSWNGCPAEALLLDSSSDGAFGGTGETFDWSIAAGSQHKVILAGGLEAANVRQAIDQARPWGVDACSRLEKSPGRKDHVKMAAFIKAAQEAV